MAAKRYPSNGTGWAAWTLGDLEKRAVEFAGDLSPQFKRALAEARRKYAAGAAKVRREPLALGVTLWGPVPGAHPDSRIMWDGPGSGLYWQQLPSGPGLPIRHPAASGPYHTLREADRAARRFIAIGLDDAARDAAAQRGGA